MNTENLRLPAALLCGVLLLPTLSSSAIAGADTSELLEAAIASPNRSAEDRARDSYRRPQKTLEFFGIGEDMRVLELVPGGGWYTHILGPFLREKGQLYLAVGYDPSRLKLQEEGLEYVLPAGSGFEFQRAEVPGYKFNLGPGNLGVDNLDMALTFRNVHNLTPAARKALNQAVYEALAPGGVYGVLGHTGRHMSPETAETWRRTDPVLIIKELLDAGFVFEAYSDLHHNPVDQLVHDTRHETLGTNSDRFTLKFRKPVN